MGGRSALLPLGLALVACGPARVVDDDPDDDAAGPVLDVAQFATDAPAVGGGWYAYDQATHILTPRSETYVVRDEGTGLLRFAALQIRSYYDEDSAESGIFTLAIADHDGASWSPLVEQKLTTNVKDAPVCLDLFSASSRACTGEDWQLQLRTDPFFVVEEGFAVKNPGLFVRSVAGAEETVRIATVAGLDLPADPSAIPLFVDAADGADTAWPHDELAVDLPVRGMALGHRPFTASDDTITFVHHGDGTVARFVARVVDDLATFTVSTGLVEDETRVLGEMSAIRAVDVDVPSPGGRVFLSFADEDLVVDSAQIDDGSVYLARDGLAWHLALERDADGPRLVLSPAAVALMTTGDVEETRPPEVDP